MTSRLLAAALAALLAACASSGRAPASDAPASTRASAAQRADPIALDGGPTLFARFDDDASRPRLLVLASPT